MKTLTGFVYYPDSLEEADGITYFLVRSEDENTKYLGIMGRPDGFEHGQGIAGDSGATTHLFPLTSKNAAVLRERLPWLRPQALGLRLTAGFGDRLGLATPGHVKAVDGTGIGPIFAQQSVRENVRTHRTPQQVMDDAMWGVLQTGWRLPWGADADHLKTPADMDAFIDAGYTFFTIDPGEYVDDAAQTDEVETLWKKVSALPWDQLHATLEAMKRLYLNQVFRIENFSLSFDETTLLRALAKYERALAHVVLMANHLDRRLGSQDRDLEISVDETELPTSPEEHFLIASELTRLGVHWCSLAPRFVGRFEKGVDYMGDLVAFETEFTLHATIARHFGNYRLSLHSGSDKFDIYDIAARQSGDLIHLKTAGTSYLEALRVIAQVNPHLFRKVTHLAVERYETDRASDHISARLSKMPDPDQVPEHELPNLAGQFDTRQALHVTYGAVIERFGPELLETLRANEDVYYEGLYEHFHKHLDPFISNRGKPPYDPPFPPA